MRDGSRDHNGDKVMENIVLLKDAVRFNPAGVRALEPVNLTVTEGEFTAVLGGPGSGKTTLIYLISGMEPPSSGTVTVLGKELDRMAEKQRAAFRNEHIGIVPKTAVFIEEFSAAENTALPLMARGMDKRNAVKQAGNILNAFGLKEHMKKRAGSLRPYERRMASLARAWAGKPSIILMDEPETELNEVEKEGLLKNLQVITHSGRCTIICATADETFASAFKRMLRIVEGTIIEEKHNE